jgi:hypothetical protein
MQRPAKPFGRRNAAPAGPAPGLAATPAAALSYPLIPPAEDDEAELPMPVTPGVVPRSFRAAILAGLVVGCALAGFDTGQGPRIDAALKPFLELDGVAEFLAKTGFSTHPGAQATPYLIAFSLIGGARLAATTLLIAHRLLHWLGQTGFGAYALASGSVSAAYTALFLILGDVPPAHGWAVDIAAGAGAGLLYRMLAGVKPSPRSGGTPSA